jgi:predicted PolB exonuclease-like 3'-5' exonuclease
LTCSVRATKRSVTLYDYEFDLNEAKREIKIMNNNYVNQMEEQLKTVMGS